MRPMNRRSFLIAGIGIAARAASAVAFDFNVFKPESLTSGPDDIHGTVFKNGGPKTLWRWSKEAFSYTTLANNGVQCDLCPNACILSPGDLSVCRSRVNMGGRLYSLAYGNPCAVHVDPVEKKPLLHFMPRTLSFSIATTGCNFRCLNCQNWEISQARPHEVRHHELFPKDVVSEAGKNGAASIAYTYSEATTFYEYMIDTSRLAREKGLKNLYISNGYINQGPLKTLCGVLDAANINLKSFNDAIYKKLNGGHLDPVLETLETLSKKNVHLEITNLVVPGYTDKDDMVRKMCAWIMDHLGPDHPLHFSRFFPMYKLDRLSPTPVATLTRFREIALSEGIRHVYVGNVPGHEGNHTYCHSCKKRVLERKGYSLGEIRMTDGCCDFCGTRIPGVWS